MQLFYFAFLCLLLSGSPPRGDKKVAFALQIMLILLRKESIAEKRLLFYPTNITIVANAFRQKPDGVVQDIPPVSFSWIYRHCHFLFLLMPPSVFTFQLDLTDCGRKKEE